MTLDGKMKRLVQRVLDRGCGCGSTENIDWHSPLCPVPLARAISASLTRKKQKARAERAAAKKRKAEFDARPDCPLHCGHKLHFGRCGQTDAAGDTCDCDGLSRGMKW